MFLERGTRCHTVRIYKVKVRVREHESVGGWWAAGEVLIRMRCIANVQQTYDTDHMRADV